MSKSLPRCSMCNHHHSEMHSLPFKGPVCDKCIGSQCAFDLSDDELLTDFSVDNFSVMFQDSNQIKAATDQPGIGRKLYQLKHSLDSFQADVRNYTEMIRRQIELTRTEIFINYNFCKNRFEMQRSLRTKNLVKYKHELAGLLDTDVLNKLKQNAAKHAENFNKINNDSCRVSLMELENFIKTLKADLSTANLILFSNKKITYAIPERTNFHILDLGTLKFNDCDELVANNVIKDFLGTSPYFSHITRKPNIFNIRSSHILSESLLLVCYDTFNEITLKRFLLKNSHISYQYRFLEKKPERKLLTGNNHQFFVTCACFENGNFELILFDDQLRPKKKNQIAGKGMEPASIHLTVDNLFVVMASAQNKLTIRRFNMSLEQSTSDVELFGIQLMGKRTFDVKTFSTNGFKDLIFIKQKFLLGTRVTAVDLRTNEVMWRVDLNYFFDKYYVDCEHRQLLFFCQGMTFVYDIASRKYVSTMSFHQSEKCICEFDFFRDGEIYFITPLE